MEGCHPSKLDSVLLVLEPGLLLSPSVKTGSVTVGQATVAGTQTLRPPWGF